MSLPLQTKVPVEDWKRLYGEMKIKPVEEFLLFYYLLPNMSMRDWRKERKDFLHWTEKTTVQWSTIEHSRVT